MKSTKDRPRSRPRPHRLGPEDFDERGAYLYPGDVEDAMPEGNLALLLAEYLRRIILRLVCDLRFDSAYQNLPIYYEAGTQRHVAPDVFYLRGVPYDEELRSYLLWKTGVPPAVAFEIVSRSNKDKDVVRNREVYARLGIAEYYWFDPESVQLAALTLDPATHAYVPMAPDSSGRFHSPALGLEVGLRGSRIGLFEAGAYIPPDEELLRQEQELRRDLQETLDAQKRQREDAERRVRELESRLREIEGQSD